MECGFDHGAVVGGALPQPRDPNAGRLETLEYRRNLFRRTANDLMRPVVGGDAEADALRGRIVRLQRLRDAVRR